MGLLDDVDVIKTGKENKSDYYFHMNPQDKQYWVDIFDASKSTLGFVSYYSIILL